MQEESTFVGITFLAYISLFELFHSVLIDFILKIFGYELDPPKFVDEYFKILFVSIGLSLNYFIFIRTKLIYRIYDFYQAQNRTNWKDNLLFLLYMVVIFFLNFIFVETSRGSL
jgi:hypothetical protein